MRACLQGGRVTLASGVTLHVAGGQKAARIYMQNFTGTCRVTLHTATTYFNVRLHSKGLETNKKLTRVGGLTLPGVFTRERVNPLARVILAAL